MELTRFAESRFNLRFIVRNNCDFNHARRGRMHSTVLNRLKIRNNPGAAPVPRINTTDDRGTWRLLNCTAHGDPEPELEWLSSDGEVLNKSVPGSQSEGSQVDLLLNVTKSNTYTCVATQREICHRVSNSRIITIPEPSIGWTRHVVSVAVPSVIAVILPLMLFILIAFLIYRNRSLKEALRAQSKLKQQPLDASD